MTRLSLSLTHTHTHTHTHTQTLIYRVNCVFPCRVTVNILYAFLVFVHVVTDDPASKLDHTYARRIDMQIYIQKN
jgi:hypothetical protein